MTGSTQTSAVTKCPHCSAKFRVRAEQVQLHSGLVRCGACRGIFDAVEHLIEGTLPHNDPFDEAFESDPPHTIVQGMPAVQDSAEGPHDSVSDSPQSTAAASPVAQPVVSSTTLSTAADSAGTPTNSNSETAEHIELKPLEFSRHGELEEPAVRNTDAQDPAHKPDQGVEADALNRYRWREPERKTSTGRRWAYGLLSLLSLVGLVAQGAYFFRDEAANRFPQLAPSLAFACEQIGCRVQPPKRTESLGFVGADLAADPAHKGLLIFTATLRNTGERTVAYPHLVLTLDGLSGEMVARRIFSPKEFAPANANLPYGLAGGAEIEIKLYLDASQTNVVGFKVDHAYL